MEKKYIVPAVGKVYITRAGGEYLCKGNRCYFSETDQQRAVSIGEHAATFERVKDGWTLTAHGVLEYGDGTIEWNYSSGGHFAR